MVRLIERVEFDRPETGGAELGGARTGWIEGEHKCRAGFRFLRGGETVQAARLEGRQPVVVTLYRSVGALAITTDWRMRDLNTDEVYAVQSIVPTDDRVYLELTCVSGAPA